MSDLLLGVIVVALAAHRLARLVAVDDLTLRPRAWVSIRAYAWPDVPHDSWEDIEAGIVEERTAAGPIKRSQFWGWVDGLVTCPHCCGFWFAVSGWWLWWNHPDARVWVAAVGVAGLQSVVSAKGMS